MRLGRSPPCLGKVPTLFGEGPAYGWGRSRQHLGKVDFHAPDLPHRNAPTVPPDTDFPGKVPNLKFDLPHSPLGPSPFTLGTVPGGTQYPARREMTGALRLLGITVGAIRNQSEGANWLLGVHQHLCKLLLFNTLQNSLWTVAPKNGGVSMMHFVSYCNSKCYETADGQHGGQGSRRGKGRRTA